MADIIFERRDGGAFVTFNRPQVRNALTPEMLLETADFITTIDGEPEVRFLVFQGAGNHFAAGGDVASYSKLLERPAAERRAYFERRVRNNAESFVRLEGISIPVISLIRGAAAGAGLSFILASDFVLASANAKLIFAQPRVGLPIDLSATYFLPRIVGAKKARQLAFLGAIIDVSEAKRLGIIDEIHADNQLESALAALVAAFRVAAPAAAGRSKLLVNQSARNTIVDQMELEVRAIGQCVVEPDFAEGVTAFIKKRKAEFTGRPVG